MTEKFNPADTNIKSNEKALTDEFKRGNLQDFVQDLNSAKQMPAEMLGRMLQDVSKQLAKDGFLQPGMEIYDSDTKGFKAIDLAKGTVRQEGIDGSIGVAYAKPQEIQKAHEVLDPGNSYVPPPEAAPSRPAQSTAARSADSPADIPMVTPSIPHDHEQVQHAPEAAVNRKEVPTDRNHESREALVKGIESAIPPGTTVHFSQEGNELKYQPDHNLSQRQWNALGSELQKALNQNPELVQLLGQGKGTDITHNGIVDHTAPAVAKAHSESGGYNPNSGKFELGADKLHQLDQAKLNANVSGDQMPYYPKPTMIGNVSDSRQEYLHNTKLVTIGGHQANVSIGNGEHDIKIPVDAEPPMNLSAALPRGVNGGIAEVSGYLVKGANERRYFYINHATIETITVTNGQKTIHRQDFDAGQNGHYDIIPLKKPNEG